MPSGAQVDEVELLKCGRTSSGCFLVGMSHSRMGIEEAVLEMDTVLNTHRQVLDVLDPSDELAQVGVVAHFGSLRMMRFSFSPKLVLRQ